MAKDKAVSEADDGRPKKGRGAGKGKESAEKYSSGGSYGCRLPQEWQPVLNAWSEMKGKAELNRLVQMAMIAFLQAEGLDKELKKMGVTVPAVPLAIRKS